MQLTQIECFVAVAEERSFTRAAERLFMAQPNVSNHIRRLEAELGVTLFDRGRHGARLTEAGEELLPHARSALASLDRARAEVQELTGLLSGHVTIGVGVYSVVDEVAEMVSDFRALHPGVSVEIEDALLVESTGERLRRGELDLAVVSEGIAERGIASEPFAQMVVRLAVPRHHRFAERASVSVAELEGEDLIFWRTHPTHETLTEACRELGFEPRRSFTCRTMAMVRALVAHGLGSAAVSTTVGAAFSQVAAVVDLGPPRVTRDYYLCWRTDTEHSPATRTAIDHARSFAAARLGSPTV